MVDEKLLAPCGLYCGVCGVRIATRDKNEKFREILAGFYGVAPDDLHCEGCQSDVKAVFCQVCNIRSCSNEKGFLGCHECEDWPCEHILTFPVPVGKKVIMRAVPTWRELGTEEYVRREEERYHCPECGYEQFRGAKRCRQCKTELDLD